MSTCQVNAYSACIFLLKKGEICCILPSAWILFQFVSMFHFYFPSQGAIVVFTSKHAGHQQPPLEQLFYDQEGI